MNEKLTAVPKATEPAPADPYETSLFAAELGDEVPTLDLHGVSVDEALYEVENFLHRKHPPGTDAVRIVHGRGTQKLRDAVHRWLRMQTEFVGAFRDSRRPGETGGVTVVAFRKD